MADDLLDRLPSEGMTETFAKENKLLIMAESTERTRRWKRNRPLNNVGCGEDSDAADYVFRRMAKGALTVHV